MSPIYDVDNWARMGRGHAFAGYVLEEELKSLIKSILMKEHQEYSFITYYIEQQQGVYRHIPLVVEPERFFSAEHMGMRDFYIHDKRTFSGFDVTRFHYPHMGCNLNGLVGIQFSTVFRKGRGPAVLGVVDRVKHNETNELRAYSESLRLWRTLKIRAARLLRYSTISELEDGTHRESETPKMSEAYAEKVRLGEIEPNVKIGRYFRPKAT